MIILIADNYQSTSFYRKVFYFVLQLKNVGTSEVAEGFRRLESGFKFRQPGFTALPYPPSFVNSPGGGKCSLFPWLV